MSTGERVDEEVIYLVLSQSLLSGQLSAGAKLGEEKLGAIFGVSRERIRNVLRRLGHERLIDVFPNRGAFVANPSFADARQIYEARRILEGGMVWRLAETLSAEQLKQLKKHFVNEEHAHARNRRADTIRLSGAFHVLLAEMTQNQFVVRETQELVSRTSMLVALFEEGGYAGCGVDEHRSILDALETRNPATAARTMIAHLSSIEARLRPRNAAPQAIDVEATLTSAIKARGRRLGNAGMQARRKN